MPVLVTAFVRRVTAPDRANNPPTSEVPVPTVTPSLAMKTALSVFEPPRIAVLPTQKKTLHAFAPFNRAIMELMPEVKVVPIWKMNCALGLLLASRVSVPAKAAVVAKL